MNNKLRISTVAFILLCLWRTTEGGYTGGNPVYQPDIGVEAIPTNALVIICSLVLACIWLGCVYFMCNGHLKATAFLQVQLDQLWLLQAKPSVWPHAPFIPNPLGDNPPEYVPPMDPEQREQAEMEAQERAKMAIAFLKAHNEAKL